MATGTSVSNSMSCALDDAQVSLNLDSGTMDVVKSGASISVGSIQPTVNPTIRDVLAHETTLSYVSIAPSATRGVVLYSVPIDPSSMVSGGNPSRVAWISKLYRFWRGDMKFRFVFTKTILQQTKILAVFVPGASRSDPPPSPDAAYFYNHKVLMNPANETEWTLDVPFVSANPFRLMGESTGMLYVMLFQNLVVSSADASDIYFSIFVAGTGLNFHELVQLPPIAAQSAIDPTNAFIIENFLGNALTTTSTGTRTFLSDNNSTLATSLFTSTGTTGNVISNGTPVAASGLVADFTNYNASTMRTISGNPFGSCASKRVIGCVQSTTSSGAAYGTMAALTVYIWSDLSYAIAPASVSEAMTFAGAAVQDSYGAIFPSSFTRANNEDLNDRIRVLESALHSLLSSMRDKK